MLVCWSAYFCRVFQIRCALCDFPVHGRIVPSPPRSSCLLFRLALRFTKHARKRHNAHLTWDISWWCRPFRGALGRQLWHPPAGACLPFAASCAALSPRQRGMKKNRRIGGLIGMTCAAQVARICGHHLLHVFALTFLFNIQNDMRLHHHLRQPFGIHLTNCGGRETRSWIGGDSESHLVSEVPHAVGQKTLIWQHGVRLPSSISCSWKWCAITGCTN